MTDEIEKVESQYDRHLREERERLSEKHEIDKMRFRIDVEHVERLKQQHESNLIRDAAIVEQAHAVATMANNVANLTRAQEEGQSLQNEQARLAESRSRLVDLGIASVRPSHVLVVLDDRDHCRVMCVENITLNIPLSRAEVLARLTVK